MWRCTMQGWCSHLYQASNGNVECCCEVEEVQRAAYWLWRLLVVVVVVGGNGGECYADNARHQIARHAPARLQHHSRCPNLSPTTAPTP